MRAGVFLMAALAVFVCAESKVNPKVLPLRGVEVNVEGKKTTISRIQPKDCLNLGIETKTVWGGEYAGSEVPKPCKKEYVATLGMIQPMQLDLAIKTFGELETLEFIEKAQKEPQKYVLADSRKSDWYQKSTIPSALNIPYDDLVYDEDFKTEYKKALELAGVKITKNGLDFKEAKNILLFCNGSWCGQSPMAAQTLVAMGYPKEKIFWYRGGLQDWTMLSLPTYTPAKTNKN